MNRTPAFAAALSAATLALSLASLPSAAMAAEKTFGITSYDRLVVEGDLVVEVVPGRILSAKATGDRDAIERLMFDASGGTLTIRARQTGFEKKPSSLAATPLVIRLTANNLQRIALAGAGSLTVGSMGGRTSEISLRGPGRIIVTELKADRTNVAMIGNGTMTLAGTTQTLDVLTSGAGGLDGSALPTTDLVVRSEGAGDLRFTASRAARVTARGIGTVTVDGKAACTVTNAGSGQVRCNTGKLPK